MKKLLTLLLIIVSINLNAQDTQELGYVSFDGSLTQIDTYPTGSAGVTLALTRNWISFGIVGNFIFDSPDSSPYKELNENIKRYCGYGGILVEPTLLPKFPIHITIPLVIGIGTLKYAIVDDNSWTSYDYILEDSRSTFIVFNVGARAEINLLNSLRFTVGPSYRYIPNLYVNNMQSDMLNSFNLDFSFKIGKY